MKHCLAGLHFSLVHFSLVRVVKHKPRGIDQNFFHPTKMYPRNIQLPVSIFRTFQFIDELTGEAPADSASPNPTQLLVTGQRLSHWGTMLDGNKDRKDEDDLSGSSVSEPVDNPQTPSGLRHASASFQSGTYDNLQQVSHV